MRTRSIALTAALALASCGGGGDDSALMSDADRQAAFDALGAAYDALPHTSRDEDATAMLAAIQARPELRFARRTDDNAIGARFTDGTGFVFLFESGYDNGDLMVPLPDTAAIAPPAVQNQLPGTKVVLMTGLDASGSNAGNQFLAARNGDIHLSFVAAGFRAAAGYDVSDPAPATIAALRKVTGVDVFYYVGHGGNGVTKDGTQNEFILHAQDRFTGREASDLKDDLAADRVGYAMLEGKVGATQRVAKAGYYFTPAFVTKYMAFTANSFVFINGCGSFSAPNATLQGGGLAFFDAFTQDAHASVYAGWTEKVGALEVMDTANLLFDGMLGGNRVLAATPPLRPFPLGGVSGELDTLERPNKPGIHYTESLDPEAKNPPLGRLRADVAPLLAPDGGEFGVLRPSVAQVRLDDTAGNATVYGFFGTADAADITVTLAGQPLHVATLSPGIDTASSGYTDELVVDQVPPSIGGDLVVTVAGRASNTVPISVLSGNFHLRRELLDTPTLEYTVDFDLTVRADVHGYRTRGDREILANSRSAANDVARASTARFRASGSHTANGITQTYSGSGAIELGDGFVNSFLGEIALLDDGSGGTANVDLAASVDGAYTITTDPGGSTSKGVLQVTSEGLDSLFTFGAGFTGGAATVTAVVGSSRITYTFDGFRTISNLPNDQSTAR